MFTQKISMDCTKQQYEKYLKDELLKMGYEERCMYWGREIKIFTNAANGVAGKMLDIDEEKKERFNRAYLGEFNAELFLALAAMTDKAEGNYGEYVRVLRNGRIYKMDKEDKLPPESTLIRKATKGEILKEFGSNKELMWKSYSNTTKNLEEIYTAIELLKSKGYKILKPTNWEEVQPKLGMKIIQ